MVVLEALAVVSSTHGHILKCCFTLNMANCPDQDSVDVSVEISNFLL